MKKSGVLLLLFLLLLLLLFLRLTCLSSVNATTAQGSRKVEERDREGGRENCRHFPEAGKNARAPFLHTDNG